MDCYPWHQWPPAREGVETEEQGSRWWSRSRWCRCTLCRGVVGEGSKECAE